MVGLAVVGTAIQALAARWRRLRAALAMGARAAAGDSCCWLRQLSTDPTSHVAHCLSIPAGMR